MFETGLIVGATLVIMSTRRLRVAALALLVQFGGAQSLSGALVPREQAALLAAAAVAVALVLFVAAGDNSFGEDPGWRLAPALAVTVAATIASFAVFQTPEVDRFLQVSAFWLLAAGLGILLTAHGSVRIVLGALLMLSGALLVVRFAPPGTLGLTIVFAWAQLLLALAGAFLVVNQRAAEEW